jgi:hypothetical protein
MENKKEEEENILRKLIKARKSIRQKFASIKQDRINLQKNVKETFAPIVNPLNEIVKLSEKSTELKKENEKPIFSYSTPKKSKYNSESETEKSLQNISIKKPKYSFSKINYTASDDSDDESDGGEEDPMIENTEKTLQFHSAYEGNNSLINDYFKLYNSNDRSIDKIYGIKIDKENEKYFIVNSEVNFLDNFTKLQLGNETYSLSSGLLELLFKKTPLNFTAEDQYNYKQILLKTDVQKIKHGNSKKYKIIIKKLISTKGEGFTKKSINFKNIQKNKIDYVYWNDINELIDRLRLLYSSQSAGNNNHQNEILSIFEELKENNIIY